MIGKAKRLMHSCYKLSDSLWLLCMLACARVCLREHTHSSFVAIVCQCLRREGGVEGGGWVRGGGGGQERSDSGRRALTGSHKTANCKW